MRKLDPVAGNIRVTRVPVASGIGVDGPKSLHNRNATRASFRLNFVRLRLTYVWGAVGV